MNAQDLRDAVASLRGASVKPLCNDHKPEVTEYEGTFEIHCPNCNFTAYGCKQDLEDSLD